jgi:hypothetical protein
MSDPGAAATNHHVLTSAGTMSPAGAQILRSQQYSPYLWQCFQWSHPHHEDALMT